MDFVLTLLGILLVGLLAIVLALGVVTVVTGVGVAKSIEWLAHKLIPGKRTGVGVENLVGETGKVVRAVPSGQAVSAQEGMVELGGELWKARSRGSSEIAPGHRVRVVEVDRLLVLVEPLDDRSGS